MKLQERKTRLSGKIAEIREAGHDHALAQSQRLEAVLTRLRYEGKASLGKNLKGAKEVLDFFKKELVQHMQLEDQVTFPFLETHLPKLETALLLLRSEHEDFRRNLVHFESWLNLVAKEKKSSNHVEWIEKLKEIGTYMVYLLQSHLQVEEVVFQIASRELRAEEKRELLRLQNSYLKREDSNGHHKKSISQRSIPL